MSGGVLEIPAFFLGVASLFTSCVDAFGYFKLYQSATRDIEIVLLKLDIEKARLLIWGDNVRILSANPGNSTLLNQQIADLVKDILSKIQDLLTDSEKLRTTYGARAPDSSRPRIVDYISTKSLAIFTPLRSRWLARNSSALRGFTRGSAAARAMWAIHDQGKFQKLVIELANFVDKLFEFTKISREAQDQVIVEDIESIIDVAQLAIVEDGTENYPTYLEAARSARASTEAGTLDRRTLEEHIRDVENIPGATASAHDASGLEALPSELQYCEMYLVLTSPCRRQTTSELCDVRVLGSQVATIGLYPHLFETLTWDISSRSGGRYTIGHLLQDAIGVKKVVREAVEDGILHNLIGAAHSEQPTPEQQALIDATLPVLNVFIYCAPCVCLIHTALAICRIMDSPFVNVQFRPDSRLAASCCLAADRSLGVKCISAWVRDWGARGREQGLNLIAKHLDIAWLDQRLEHLDYEQPYDFREYTHYRRRYIILGEANYTSHMVQTASGRIPRATDVWHLKPNNGAATRTLSGRFVEYQPEATQNLAAQGAPLGVNNSPTIKTTLVQAAASAAQPPNRKRPASPSSSASASLRPRYDLESRSNTESDPEPESIAASMAEEII